MGRTPIAVLFVISLLLPLGASAHDASKHKGKATNGEIVSVAADRLELKTEAGVKVVQITAETKYERGDQAASRTDLKKGDSITVMGTTLATGEIVAKEILLGGAEAHGQHKHEADHKH